MVLNFNLRKRSVATMTIYEIGFTLIFWALSIVYFYTMGVNSGYIEGRKALRKHYEQRDKVRV